MSDENDMDPLEAAWKQWEEETPAPFALAVAFEEHVRKHNKLLDRLRLMPFRVEPTQPTTARVLEILDCAIERGLARDCAKVMHL